MNEIQKDDFVLPPDKMFEFSEINREISERLQWFLAKVGKVLFRNDNGCTCSICMGIEENGLLVHDEMHATYLYDNECEYAAEGSPLRYFDTKEEVNQWLNTLQK